MGLMDLLFGKRQEKKLDSWKEAQIATNKAVRFVPESGLTEEERAMAGYATEMFQEMFSGAVFNQIKPGNTYDYKIFREEDGEVVYGHDLNEFEGPFLVSPQEMAAIEKEKGFSCQALKEEAEKGYTFFQFRKGNGIVVFYAAPNGESEFICSDFSI